MKTELLLPILLGLATGFVMPVVAQEKTEFDPKTLQGIEMAAKQYDEACNKNDASAIAALFMPDAIEVGPEGRAYGAQSIQKRYSDGFAKWHQTDHLNTIDRAYMIAKEAVAIMKFSVGEVKGYVVTINAQDGDTWKIQLAVYNVTPTQVPATPTPTPKPTPTPTPL
jgi:ketosteroid isomerase-like protein